MSGFQHDSAILEDLEDLFSWNPPLFRLATKQMGGSFSTSTREPGWYDKHLAPDRICKKVVHVKDLHRKVAAIVDEKLQSILERKITLGPITAISYMDKAARTRQMRRTGNPAQNELSIQVYYLTVTAAFCVCVASTLALHPHTWETVIEWSPVPIAQGDAVCDGSLKPLFCLSTVKRQRDQTTKHTGPHFVDAELWQELMEVCNKYGDMAIWEMKSLSVGDGSFMLGILALATGKEQFQWQVCEGGTDHKFKMKGHHPPPTTQLEDDPEVLSKFGLNDLDPNTTSDLTINDVLDQALCRGGSSLELVRKFDRKLMQEAKGTVEEDFEPKEKEVIGTPSPKCLDLGSRPSNSTLSNPPQGEASSGLAAGFRSFARLVFWKRSQDQQGSSSATANSSRESPKPTLPEPSLTSIKVPKKRDMKISIPPPFQLKRTTSRKHSSSKSPRKTAYARKKDQQTENLGGDGDGKEERADDDDDGREGKGEPPLTAQSVLQQVSLYVIDLESPLNWDNNSYHRHGLKGSAVNRQYSLFTPATTNTCASVIARRRPYTCQMSSMCHFYGILDMGNCKSGYTLQPSKMLSLVIG